MEAETTCSYLIRLLYQTKLRVKLHWLWRTWFCTDCPVTIHMLVTMAIVLCLHGVEHGTQTCLSVVDTKVVWDLACWIAIGCHSYWQPTPDCQWVWKWTPPTLNQPHPHHTSWWEYYIREWWSDVSQCCGANHEHVLTYPHMYVSNPTHTQHRSLPVKNEIHTYLTITFLDWHTHLGSRRVCTGTDTVYGIEWKEKKYVASENFT